MAGVQTGFAQAETADIRHGVILNRAVVTGGLDHGHHVLCRTADIRAQAGGSSVPMDFSKLMDRSLEEILLDSVSAYMGIVSDKYMLRFFKVLYSERATNPIAAQIIVEETERMLQYSRNMFYALVVHGKVKNDNVDTAAMTFSLTIHSLIDYRMDMMTAGIIQEFGEEGRPVPRNITEFIGWFCHQIGA